MAYLISRQSHYQLHKKIITKLPFAQAKVSKMNLNGITVQVSCVLLSADSFEKASSVRCKSQLGLSQGKPKDQRRNLWQTNLIIAFLSVTLSVFYKLTALHCRPREGKNSHGSQREMLEKFSLQELCQNNMKITFPTTEMQPPLAQDLPDL